MGKISKSELNTSLTTKIEEIDLKANISDLETTNTQLAQITNNGQIKGFVVLTQAEYDALPSTKKTDGIAYLIRG